LGTELEKGGVLVDTSKPTALQDQYKSPLKALFSAYVMLTVVYFMNKRDPMPILNNILNHYV
jgi:hypothetical protein